jgi:RND family efflux transporter MFP subunit
MTASVSVPASATPFLGSAMRRTVASALLLGIALAIAGCQGDAPAAPPAGGGQQPPPPVGVATAITRSVPELREYTGQVEAVYTVAIQPQVSGLVTRVMVTDGAEVTAGQPILEIDRAPLFADYDKALAALAHARAVQAQARISLGRTAGLMADHITTQQQYDDQSAAVDIAKADVAAAQAALATTQLNLGYSHVNAPIAGRIGKVLTSVGNLVQGGGPVPATTITTEVSVDPVYVSFDLDETTWLRIGARLRDAAAGKTEQAVNVALDGESGYPHAGKVAWIDNNVDTRSGTIRIRAAVANPDRALTPGAFARVQLQVSDPRPVLLVNERAVASQLDSRFVYVVMDGKAIPHPVKLGDNVGPLRVVDGITDKDLLVVSGLPRVFYPGAPVTPVPANMETLEMLQAPGAPGAPPAGGGSATAPKPAQAATAASNVEKK